MTNTAILPSIIQGGMGVGISDWRLARAVSQHGQLGVVSGTAIDTVLVRRLQDGDIGGHMRRALAAFPMPEVAADVLRLYFRPDGRAPGVQYKLLPMYKQVMSRARELVIVLASFVEVYLAKEGHTGQVGMNLLTKIQIPTLPSLYGAMLAGVDVILMGAGIPREIPAALDHHTTCASPSAISRDRGQQFAGDNARPQGDGARRWLHR
jgi:nitronate monooxygenase